MSSLQWQVESFETGERLDRAIAARMPEVSRSYAANLIERGHITINGSPATKAAHKLKAGDLVLVELAVPEPSALQAENIPLSIVYEDADLLVIDKPAGMVVHPSPGHSGGTLVNAILAHVPELELDMGDEARPGIVHRLDKDTSGLMVVAKRRPAHEALSRQMAARTMRKEYLALVRGKPNPPAAVIEAPIARDPDNRQRMAVVQGGRPARTHYTTEQAYGSYTLLRCTLETGRTHQIRVHMSSTGHPILGDPTYGRSTLKDAARLGLTRQFLHATKLGFTIPSTGEWHEFDSPLPEELQRVLDELARSVTSGGPGVHT
ncbi:MAG: rRNA synthase [Chloroflexia bacterium]|jgi:23S rRNA pseudouridine1911/1915/1917 synthase|nr:rRNA synthase [Chloroflexia bacterium]